MLIHTSSLLIDNKLFDRKRLRYFMFISASFEMTNLSPIGNESSELKYTPIEVQTPASV